MARRSISKKSTRSSSSWRRKTWPSSSSKSRASRSRLGPERRRPPPAMPRPSAPAPAPSPAANNPAAGSAAGRSPRAIVHYVTSPMVGTFYRAPSPSSPPFVEVGDPVKKKQTLCIVEAMKLMNEIECDVDGVVKEILRRERQARRVRAEALRHRPQAREAPCFRRS